MKKKLLIRTLKGIQKELDEHVWQFVAENSPLDYGCAVPYCSLENLIQELRKEPQNAK